MRFHNVRFPEDISLGATGGPVRKVEVQRLASGYEIRNAVWAGALREYSVGSGVKTLEDLYDVLAFFEARGGKLHGFRFKDWSDYQSCAPMTKITAQDQMLGLGDGFKQEYQLIKTYISGGYEAHREIKKPVLGSVCIAFDGVEQNQGAFDVDHEKGLVHFVSAPSSEVVITAGFEFDVPVRFDCDALNINIAHFDAGEIPSIPLIEILEV